MEYRIFRTDALGYQARKLLKFVIALTISQGYLYSVKPKINGLLDTQSSSATPINDV